MDSAKRFTKKLLKDKVVGKTKTELLAACLIYGSINYGPSEEGLEEVKKWIKKSTYLLNSPYMRNKMKVLIERLRENKVFQKNGVSFSPEAMKNDDLFYVEYCLLINVALGYLNRVDKKKKKEVVFV